MEHLGQTYVTPLYHLESEMVRKAFFYLQRVRSENGYRELDKVNVSEMSGNRSNPNRTQRRTEEEIRI
jgi:hypothetical protein